MAKTRNLGNLSDFLTATGTNVTTTTPAQFDNSTGLATTAFVQKAVGTLSTSVSSITTNTTLTTAQSGSFFEVSGASGAPVITLPAATTATVTYNLVNTATTYGFSITSASNIFFNGNSATTWALPIGSAITVYSDGTQWFVTNMSGVSTTAPQFDNTARNATTAFVQRSLGNMQGIITYAVSTVIPVSAVGSWIAPTAGSLTLTLPVASSVPAGSVINLYGNSVTGTIIARQGSDVLVMGGSNLTSVGLQSNDRLSFVSIPAAGWYALGGEAAMNYSSSFATSKSTSGYQKLPSGIILQWGSTAILSGTTTYALNIAFPNGFYSITGSFGIPASSTVNFAVYSLSAFQAQNNYTGTQVAYWLAIGL